MMTAKKRILVVDDDPGVASILKIKLEYNGFKVDLAYSGEDALSLIDKNGPPDLIVLDLMLPCISGYEVCAKIKQEYGLSVPVIIHTARINMIDEKLSYMCKADAYVKKPYSNEQLEGTIKGLLKLSA